MDRTHSAHSVNLILQKVIDGGGGVIPEVNAFDLQGIAILCGSTEKTIRQLMDDHGTRFKVISGKRWATLGDFWDSIPFDGGEQECHEKPDEEAKGKGRSSKRRPGSGAP